GRRAAGQPGGGAGAGAGGLAGGRLRDGLRGGDPAEADRGGPARRAGQGRGLPRGRGGGGGVRGVVRRPCVPGASAARLLDHRRPRKAPGGVRTNHRGTEDTERRITEKTPNKRRENINLLARLPVPIF